MKNLMRIISILLAFCGIMVIILNFMDAEDLLTNNGNYDFYMFALKVFAIFSANILPIISIAVCAYCLERNDNNYIIRIIPIYMSIPIVITIIMALFDTNAEWLVNIYQFLSSTFVGVTALSLIMVIKPNNKITTILKYIAIGILALNVLLAIITQVKSYMVDTLPNVYGYKNYGGFNFSTVEETNEFASKLYSVTSFAEIFVIILLFTTNYAFSDKIELETEDIDYEAVKNDALNVANEKMQDLYSTDRIKQQQEDVKQEDDKSNSGLMNISNQLGNDSNVGTVQGQAKEVKLESTIDSFMSLSQGPVENKAISNNNQEIHEEVTNEVKEEVKVEQAVPETTAPNLDIQEQMKMRMNQTTQQNINQAPNVQQTMQQPMQPQMQQPVAQQQQNINQ